MAPIFGSVRQLAATYTLALIAIVCFTPAIVGLFLSNLAFGLPSSYFAALFLVPIFLLLVIARYIDDAEDAELQSETGEEEHSV